MGWCPITKPGECVVPETPRDVRENAPWRVAVRKACGPSVSGGPGPDVLGAFLVAVPVGTGRRLAGLGHLGRKRWVLAPRAPA